MKKVQLLKQRQLKVKLKLRRKYHLQQRPQPLKQQKSQQPPRQQPSSKKQNNNKNKKQKK